MDTAGALLITPDRGVNVGEPYDPPVMARILASTPARVAVGRVGPRYHTNTMLRFRADHAVAKDAVIPVVEEVAQKAGGYVADSSPELVREVVVPRFIAGFEDARIRRAKSREAKKAAA